MTQRKPNPWLVRPSSTSAQPSHPMGDYAAKDLKLKRVAAIARRLRLRPRERRGLPARVRGRRRQGGAEAVHAAQRARLRHLCFAAQAEPRLPSTPATPARTASSSSASSREYGLKGKFTIVGGFTPVDESLLQQMGEDGARLPSPAAGTRPQLDNPINKKFVADDPARLQGRSRRLCGRDLSLRRGARSRRQGDQRQGRGQGRAS